MKLPADTAIARKKLTHFLLAWREEDDKSAFLAKAGYLPDNADEWRKICEASCCRWTWSFSTTVNMARSMSFVAG
jgi:hypothetical protein